MSAFSIEPRLEREVLSALDDWLHRYGAHLMPSEDAFSAFSEYEPEWIRDYRGLNVINDIAIFAGDYVISKNQSVLWDMYYGDGTKYDYEEPGFGQPCLLGLLNSEYRGRPHSILNEIFDCCFTNRRRLLHGGIGGPWDVPGELVRHIDYLVDPNPPPEGRFRLTIQGNKRPKL